MRRVVCRHQSIPPLLVAVKFKSYREIDVAKDPGNFSRWQYPQASAAASGAARLQAGTVASILEMARILQKQQGTFQRGIRFAWWSGHSYGRYPGSTWYADRFWADLDEHGVACTNLDGDGRRGSRIETRLPPADGPGSASTVASLHAN